MPTDPIAPELISTLRRLKLSKMLDTLPERLTVAQKQKMPYQDFLLLVLADEVSRRDSASSTVRATQARLDPEMQLERWDPSAEVRFFVTSYG